MIDKKNTGLGMKIIMKVKLVNLKMQFTDVLDASKDLLSKTKKLIHKRKMIMFYFTAQVE